MKKFESKKLKYLKGVLNLTKFKINNKKRCRLEALNKRRTYSSPKYNKLTRLFLLKKYQLDFYQSSSSQPKTLKRKKFSINSYLHQIILRLSRRYDSHFLGKEIFRHYNTSPYQVTTTRRIMNKILRGYYKNLSYKALMNIKNKAQGPRLSFVHNKQEVKQQSWNISGNTKALAKYTILDIEQRLDSCVRRVLDFPSKTIKLRRRWRHTQRQKFKTYPQIQLKSLWNNFTALQVKQLLNHGHICLDNKKITYGSYRRKPLEKLKIKGFIPHDLCNQSLLNTTEDQAIASKNWKSSLKNTMLLKEIPFENLTRFIKIPKDNKITLSSNTKIENQTDIFYEYIKNLKIKRFTEIFYITYSNMHLIKHDSIIIPISTGKPNETLLEQIPESTHEQIQALDPINFTGQESGTWKQIIKTYRGIGYNQSVYLLWPLKNILKITPWSLRLKNQFKKIIFQLNTTKSWKKRKKMKKYPRND